MTHLIGSMENPERQGAWFVPFAAGQKTNKKFYKFFNRPQKSKHAKANLLAFLLKNVFAQ